jgi:tetratricopeptide (TPR) repeat protein
MSNVIRFFEVVGQNPELRHAKRGELKDALKRAQIDSTLQSAILDRDIVEMHALLDTQNRIYCSVFPVKVPEKKPTKAPPKKPSKAPAKKPAKKSPGQGQEIGVTGPPRGDSTSMRRWVYTQRRTGLRPSARCRLRSWLGRSCLAVALLWGAAAAAAPDDDVGQLIKTADDIKTSDYSRFVVLLKRLDSAYETLDSNQQAHVRYLRGWRATFDRDYELAIPTLKAIVDELSEDVILRFRADVTLTNALGLAGHYEEAYRRLNQTLELQSHVPDRRARMLGFAVAAQLNTNAGQYDLAASYADRWIAEESEDAGMCKAISLKVESCTGATSFAPTTIWSRRHRRLRQGQRTDVREPDTELRGRAHRRQGPGGRRNQTGAGQLRGSAGDALCPADGRVRLDSGQGLPEDRR